MSNLWRTCGLSLRQPWSARAALWLVLLMPLLLPWDVLTGTDIDLYRQYAQQLWEGKHLYSEVPVEYPPVAVLWFVLPSLLSYAPLPYTVLFICSMGGLDVVQRLALRQQAGRDAPWMLGLTTLASAALYYTYLKRFDVAVATLCSLALCRLLQRPHSRGAWGLLVLSTACKLYPVVLAPLFWCYSAAQGVGFRQRLVQVGSALGLGGLILATSYSLGGAASWRWLAYHQQRGLQIASNYTALHVLGGGFGQALPLVGRFGCVEIAAPWASAAAQAAPWISLLSLLLTYARVLPQLLRAPQPTTLWRGALALVLVLLLTSKVFSPQFVIWLVPLTGMAILPAGRAERVDAWLAGLFLLVCVLTAELFPGEFHLGHGDKLRQACLVGRFVLMLGMWWRLCGPAWAVRRAAVPAPPVAVA